MNRLYLIFYIHLVFSCNLESQDYFFKTWKSEYTASGQQINEFNGNYYLSAAKICDDTKECSFFSEIDLLGNEVWRKDLNFLDITHRTTFIEDDTIYIAGNDYVSGQKFILHKMSIDGDSITTFDIFSPGLQYSDMFLLAIQKYNNNIVLAGTGEVGQDNFSLVYIIDKEGKVEKVVTPTSNTFFSIIWDIKIDHDNNLVFFINRQNNFENAHRQILKYNQDFLPIWSYTTDSLNHDRAVTKGCILNDGKIAFVTTHASRPMEAVHTINPDSTINWIYEWPNVNFIDIKIHRLKTLNNGDILGMGRTTNYENNPIIEDDPFIFRMTPDGELLWERTFVEIDPEDGESKGGAICDVEELENGDLLGTGYLRNESWDVLLFKTDANGCIHEEDCDQVSVITTTKELSDQYTSVKIFPQPAIENQVTLQIDEAVFSSDLQIHCFDLQGRKLPISIDKITLQEYIISQLPKGISFLEIIDQNGKRIVEKIAKL